MPLTLRLVLSLKDIIFLWPIKNYTAGNMGFGKGQGLLTLRGSLLDVRSVIVGCSEDHAPAAVLSQDNASQYRTIFSAIPATVLRMAAAYA